MSGTPARSKLASAKRGQVFNYLHLIIDLIIIYLIIYTYIYLIRVSGTVSGTPARSKLASAKRGQVSI